MRNKYAVQVVNEPSIHVMTGKINSAGTPNVKQMSRFSLIHARTAPLGERAYSICINLYRITSVILSMVERSGRLGSTVGLEIGMGCQAAFSVVIRVEPRDPGSGVGKLLLDKVLNQSKLCIFELASLREDEPMATPTSNDNTTPMTKPQEILSLLLASSESF